MNKVEQNKKNSLKEGKIIRQDGKTFMVLKVHKKSVSLREIFVRKDKSGFRMGEFYKAKIILQDLKESEVGK